MRAHVILIISLAVWSTWAFNTEQRGRFATTGPFLVVVNKTVTQTVTATGTSTVLSSCAKLINVTAKCRRRRDGKWVEGYEPVVLTFDDSIEVDQYLNPSPVEKMEYSRAPRFYDDFILGRRYQAPIGSIAQPLHYQNDDDQGPRIYFNQLATLFPTFNRVYPNITFTNTITAFQLAYEYTQTDVHSFFIMGCTPAPFPFPVCS